MASYIAVVTLMQDLEQLLSSYSDIFGLELQEDCPFTKEEIEILYDNVSLMDSLLRDSSGESYNRDFMDQILEKRISDVARKAGNYVDFWAAEYLGVSRMRGIITVRKLATQEDRAPISYGLQRTGGLTLNDMTEEIASITEELQKIHHDRKVTDFDVTSSPGTSLTFSSPLRRTTNAEGKVVGLGDDLVTMLDSLTGYPSKLKVFSIIGMAGIGKTTFSRTLYHDPLVMHHFYVRAWVTVSQQYQLREMLLGILCCVANVSDEIYGKCNEELKEQVYRSLKGKRYLIVLDDMWDTKAWDDLRRTLPDDGNGSRIMLTSRLRDVAVHASQDTPPHYLHCLSMDESWELLSSKIFMDESCPVELVSIGKQIAYKCQGLPLAIVVVGGLLSKMNKKVDVWEEVAQGVGSLVMEEADHCQNILALSYSHLPDHLKACFLYMGIFPQDYEVSVKKLIWLWVAEGFIRPSMLKSLEEVAVEYLEDLITRSLILVKRRGSDGGVKTCYIHDLMRELCVTKSQKQNFFHVINNCGQLPLKNVDDALLAHLGYRKVPSIYLHHLRRLSFHSSARGYVSRGSFPYTRSVLYFEKLSASDNQSYLSMDFKLLKVLDMMNIHLKIIPPEMSNLTQLKFLAFTAQCSLPRNLFAKFCNLQILIVDCEWNGHLPSKFWDMRELRHFHLKWTRLSTYSFGSLSTSVLELQGAELPPRINYNLQSLSTISPISCTEEVFRSMPNLKKLGIHETEEDYQFRGWFCNLVHLLELEKLKYVFGNPFVSSNLKPDRLPSWNSFPPKLRKLTLSGTSLPWDDIFKLSMLPKLEVLKLGNYAFSGAVWKCMEGGFRCLKFLLIGSTNLETWQAEGTDFPSLQHLVLRHCRFLKEIPCGIGEAPLLRKIELHRCRDSAVTSARQIQEEQQSLGNDDLDFRSLIEDVDILGHVCRDFLCFCMWESDYSGKQCQSHKSDCMEKDILVDSSKQLRHYGKFAVENVFEGQYKTYASNWVEESIWPVLAQESLKALGGLGLLSLGGKYLLRSVFELGAFLAGALLAKTNFGTQFEADIRPFRSLFLGIFFVTTGSSIDMQLLIGEWPNVYFLLAGLIVIKTLIITAIGPRVGLTLQGSMRIGQKLADFIGEKFEDEKVLANFLSTLLVSGINSDAGWPDVAFDLDPFVVKDMMHMLDLKRAGAIDMILQNAKTSLQVGSKLVRGYGVVSDEVSFVTLLVRELMELQAQEALGRSDAQDSNVMEPLAQRLTAKGFPRYNDSLRPKAAL
ncbi:Apoptotic ATPase [Handroanthus impetiginosus]|uniref:Apoptotic ATPase n=1 Tax=Handroanthus impetiginosus TaxID=429701 RepID=A0A2G9HHK0_9LAMI|nr:Apoptotic ATPase [Handroanthus impetiginosus]